MGDERLHHMRQVAIDYVGVCTGQMEIDDYQQKYGYDHSFSNPMSEPLTLDDVVLDMHKCVILSRERPKHAIPYLEDSWDELEAYGDLDPDYCKYHIDNRTPLRITGRLYVGSSDDWENHIGYGLYIERIEAYIGDNTPTIIYQESEDDDGDDGNDSSDDNDEYEDD